MSHVTILRSLFRASLGQYSDAQQNAIIEVTSHENGNMQLLSECPQFPQFSPALWCSEYFATVQGTSVQHSDVELVGPKSHIDYTHFY